MGVHAASVSSNTIQNATIVTTAETVIATTPPIIQPIDNALVLVLWTFSIALAAATATLSMRLRRGTTTGGTLVNVSLAPTVTASATVMFAGHYFDTPGVVAGQQYSMCVVCGSAGANSTVNDVCITALAL